MLVEMNCDEVQSYYFGRPVAASQVKGVIRDGLYEEDIAALSGPNVVAFRKLGA